MASHWLDRSALLDGPDEVRAARQSQYRDRAEDACVRRADCGRREQQDASEDEECDAELYLSNVLYHTPRFDASTLRFQTCSSANAISPINRYANRIETGSQLSDHSFGVLANSILCLSRRDSSKSYVRIVAVPFSGGDESGTRVSRR